MKSPLPLPLTLVCSLFCLTTAIPAASGQSLLPNGNFEAKLDQWKISAPRDTYQVADEGGNHFLVLENSNSNVGCSVVQTISVKPGQWFEFTGRMWVKRMNPGAENWHNARIQLSWRDADNKDVKPWPPSPGYPAVTDGWDQFSRFLKAPPGTVSLVVAPAIYYATGEAAFDDLSLKVVNELDVPMADRNKYK